jgi:hypothetical protein
MRLVLLIAVLSGCSASAPVPSAPKPAEPPAEAAETLWDRGTFVTVERDLVLPGIEETFEIYRRERGYRIAVRWKRPAPTGEPADGETTLLLDERLATVQGSMLSNLHETGRDRVTRSTIQREHDGRLTTEIVAADGSKEHAGSKQPNDWFIGGSITSFLFPLCRADASVTAPIVYPDKVTSLAPPRPVAIDGRHVTVRELVYEKSQRHVYAACENGKLAGEIVHGTAIVRSGDLVLAKALQSL